MLTPEEKQRIEDEERKRIAEEEYRAEVRANLRQGVPTQDFCASLSPRPRRLPAAGLAIALGGLLILVVILLSSRGKQFPASDGSAETTPRPASTPAAPSVRYVPASQQIASGQVVVPARGYVQYRIEIPQAAREAHVSGNFNASGGRGNDVAVALTSESEFANWVNGHAARAYYATPGKETTDTFDVRLGPGTYVFGVSNRFGMLSNKYVFLSLNLSYQRLETY